MFNTRCYESPTSLLREDWEVTSRLIRVGYVEVG